ncbi:MAG TPA: nucleotidyl transferase [Thermoanaerobaculia bacterium]|nr:nucleotidyl transferase [Thermoanaerobaculia bacterium]
MPLSAEDIQKAFADLSDELAQRGERAQIAITGGAALVLLFNARQTTKDVDVFIVQPDPPLLREVAVQVARKLEPPEDWLNDGAKGYFTAISEGEVVYESSFLLVRAVTTEQLLGMKLAAWRDAIDRGDARLLLSRLSGSAEEIWLRVEPFVPRAYVDKASYAFDDLWESMYGNS